MLDSFVKGLTSSLTKGITVWEYFPELISSGLWAVVGWIVGLLILALPFIILTVKMVLKKSQQADTKTITLLSTLLIAYFGISEYIETLTDTISNQTILTVLYIVAFAGCWGFSMFTAIRAKVDTAKQ